MSTEVRLAEIVVALDEVGLTCLVMGGHAVRHYGVDRNTLDFDLHLAPERWDELPGILERLPLFAGQGVVAGPSWRPTVFRRFQIGRLPDGREEWLEFWKANHLLPPFAELYSRREIGEYGGRRLPFLALPDLIRSKETERNSDWQDVALLEEILDARGSVRCASGPAAQVQALAQVRSRRGFERLLQLGHLAAPPTVRQALQQTQLPIPRAFLLPFAPEEAVRLPHLQVPIDPVIANRLRTTEPGSTLHVTLVEAVRRQYKLAMQAADRAEKERARAEQEGGRPPRS